MLYLSSRKTRRLQPGLEARRQQALQQNLQTNEDRFQAGRASRQNIAAQNAEKERVGLLTGMGRPTTREMGVLARNQGDTTRTLIDLQRQDERDRQSLNIGPSNHYTPTQGRVVASLSPEQAAQSVNTIAGLNLASAYGQTGDERMNLLLNQDTTRQGNVKTAAEAAQTQAQAQRTTQLIPSEMELNQGKASEATGKGVLDTSVAGMYDAARPQVESGELAPPHMNYAPRMSDADTSRMRYNDAQVRMIDAQIEAMKGAMAPADAALMEAAQHILRTAMAGEPQYQQALEVFNSMRQKYSGGGQGGDQPVATDQAGRPVYQRNGQYVYEDGTPYVEPR